LEYSRQQCNLLQAWHALKARKSVTFYNILLWIKSMLTSYALSLGSGKENTSNFQRWTMTSSIGASTTFSNNTWTFGMKIKTP
jgi:hypothetical protein